MSFSIENLHSLICPITHELFIEPVIGSDCYTYERSAIVCWLQIQESSPMTKEAMSLDSLRSNFAIKQIIEELSHLNKINRNSPPPPPPPPIPPRQPKILIPINQNELNNRVTDEDDITTVTF